MKRLYFRDAGFARKLEKLLRSGEGNADISARVSSIIADVRKGGDKAVCKWTKCFDRADIKPSGLLVSEEEFDAACERVPKSSIRAMKEAARSIRDFHKRTLPSNWRDRNHHGARLGENFYPLDRVGLYIPGGQVPLVSTALMTAIPASVAGVPELMACSPPGSDGKINDSVLAAFRLCGVSEVYKAGGVQAIAAMACGTGSLRPVAKIAGPGSAYVIEAKRQLFGEVGIDLLPGPSEIMVVADKSAKPAYAAAELLAQAEHGTGKERVFLGVTHASIADAIEKACSEQVKTLSHAKAIRAVLKKSVIVVIPKEDDMVDVANRIAPEHLQLMVESKRLEPMAKRITTAGSILLGDYSPTVIGDFTAGPSHTLPTGGTGRFCSGLQSIDFMRRTSVIRYDRTSIKKAASVVRAFSEMERLDAHGQSLELRLRKADRK